MEFEDNVEMTDSDETDTDKTLGQEMANGFAVSVASAAGAVVGMLVINLAVEKIQKVLENRRNRQETEPLETTTEED